MPCSLPHWWTRSLLSRIFLHYSSKLCRWEKNAHMKKMHFLYDFSIIFFCIFSFILQINKRGNWWVRAISEKWKSNPDNLRDFVLCSGLQNNGTGGCSVCLWFYFNWLCPGTNRKRGVCCVSAKLCRPLATLQEAFYWLCIYLLLWGKHKTIQTNNHGKNAFFNLMYKVSDKNSVYVYIQGKKKT